MTPAERFDAGEAGYYVIEPASFAVKRAAFALRGPYRGWSLAVQECAELNAKRLHGDRLEVRLLGTPAPSPFDRERA